MPHQVGILEALKDWGLTVVEVRGWQTRGSSSFNPEGFIAHHDVIPPMTSCPDIIINGRSDLPGPLSQFWLERNGRVHLVAAGRANHAGVGYWRDLNENADVWGCEANSLGTSADPWPQVQLDAYYRLAAACAEFSSFPVANVCGHKEWAQPPGRKSDPHTLNMNAFRASVALQTKGLTVAEIDRILSKLTDLRQTQLSQGKVLRAVRAKLGATDRDLADIDADLQAIADELGV